MKKISSLLLVISFLSLSAAVAFGQKDAEETKKLITAQDLLKAKGLAGFKPPCAIRSNASSLKTAVDLLREKGLLGKKTLNGQAVEEEDDVWGMGQDFGC